MAIIPLSVFLLRWSTLKTEISNQTEGFVILNAKSRKRGWCGLGCQVRSLSQSLRVALKSGQQCKRCEPLLTSHHCGSSILIDSCQTHVPSMAAECIQPLHRIRPPLWSVPLSSGHSGFSSLHWQMDDRLSSHPCTCSPSETGDFIDATEGPQLQGSILTNPVPRACPPTCILCAK